MFPLEFIRLTPPGRGAVAVFRLAGSDALSEFLRHWHGRTPGINPSWGRLQLNAVGDCEEAVVFSTEDGALEIQTHGGERIASAVETVFKQAGAVSKTWQEHFVPGNSQRDRAIRQIPFAPTERTLQILLDQYNGAYGREISAIEQLTPEEQQIRRTRLEDLEPLGRHLVEPFRVVLAGASNAGKSSLFNAILGFDRSLVYAEPGTTRDTVSAQTAIDGFPVTFFDSAGFRELNETDADNLERQGMNRSMQLLAEADLIIWVLDPLVEEIQRPKCPAGKNILPCWSKKDLQPDIQKTSLNVSARTGEGIEKLLNTVVQRLVPCPPKPGEAVYIAEYHRGPNITEVQKPERI